MHHTILALSLLASLAVPAMAQGNPQTPQGFWINFGFGAGSMSCDDCDDRTTGVTFTPPAWRDAEQRLLIGGEVNGWNEDRE